MTLAHRPVAVPSRGLPLLLGFGPLLLSALLVALAFVVPTEVAIGLVVTAVLAFVGAPIVMWSFLLGGARRLDDGFALYLAGRASEAEPLALRVLSTVIRGDLRARALHQLALAAEERGDFAQAAELFARTDGAIPSMAAPVHKAHVRVLVGAHRALCLALAGQIGPAHALLGAVHADLARTSTRGLTDQLLDDSTWGMGAVSMNETLLKIEGPRPPRAILALAWLVLHHARGASNDVLDLVVREGLQAGHGLLPRERALVDRIVAEAQSARGGGVWRSPGQLPAGPVDPWVEHVLRAAASSRPALVGA